MLNTQTGTPYYASPEVWKDLPYDSKSDIWSAGCVLYEMCMGHPPFMALGMDQMYLKVTRGSYKKLSSGFSNDLAKVVWWMLQVNPKDRPSCKQLLSSACVLRNMPQDF
jgi:NIMA (never in mitosis gene a)-related kinase 1/4/5